MKITSIELQNIRSFRSLPRVELSKRINVLIGPNNSGKSTILNAIHYLQKKTLLTSDITIGEREGVTILGYEGSHLDYIKENSPSSRIIFQLVDDKRNYLTSDGTLLANLTMIEASEPNNLIYPYLSKRKVHAYSDEINEANVNSVSGNFSNLFAKIDRINTPQFQPGNRDYVLACKDVLGFEIATLAKGGGKRAVYFIHQGEHIELSAMGEGVANILGLITDLCVAQNKIFLIEEPENDIHPKALKALLKLIIEKSLRNQFFVSTHSNIVMKYLGSLEETKIFNVSASLTDTKKERMFVSELKEVSPDPDERRKVLEDLGYELFDFDLWKGWLFLEEASAETIIKEYLIPTFTPSLIGKLKTFSSRGVSQIKMKFEDFNRLFVFLHLESVYKNKVWVKIDGGTEEEQIIEELRTVYARSGWSRECFGQFNRHDFEHYYPTRFNDRVKELWQIPNIHNKRKAKTELVKDVISWTRAAADDAKREFEESAKEVVQFLKEIESKL